MHNRNSNPQFATMCATKIMLSETRAKETETKRNGCHLMCCVKMWLFRAKNSLNLDLFQISWHRQPQLDSFFLLLSMLVRYINCLFFSSFRLKNKCWCRNRIFLVFYASRKQQARLSARKKLRNGVTKNTQLLKSHIVVKSFLEFHLSHRLFVARARQTASERIVLRSKSRK